MNTFIKPGLDSAAFIVNQSREITEIYEEDIDVEIIVENLNTGQLAQAEAVTFDPFVNADCNLFDYKIKNLSDDFFDEQDEYMFSFRDEANVLPETSAIASFPSKSILTEVEYQYLGGIRIDGEEASTVTVLSLIHI